MSVILDFVAPTTLDITQPLLKFNWRWILQLINGISKDLKKLLRYFSGTALFTFTNVPSSDFFMKHDFYSKDAELVELIATGILPLIIICSSLWRTCYKLSEVFE